MKQVIVILDSVPAADVAPLVLRASYAAFMNRCRRNGNILVIDQDVLPWMEGDQAITQLVVHEGLLDVVYRNASAGGLCAAAIKNELGEIIAVGVGPYASGPLAGAIPALATTNGQGQ